MNKATLIFQVAYIQCPYLAPSDHESWMGKDFYLISFWEKRFDILQGINDVIHCQIRCVFFMNFNQYHECIAACATLRKIAANSRIILLGRNVWNGIYYAKSVKPAGNFF